MIIKTSYISKSFIISFALLFYSGFYGALKCQNRQISFGKLTVEDGLSQNSIISVAQDNLGVLWMATQDGLNRYDGQKFEKFNEYFDDITKPNFSRLGKVFIDKDDQVWFISKGGVLKKYLPHNFQSFNLGFVRNANCIFQDHLQNIIVGTWNQGIHIIDPVRGVLLHKSNVDDPFLNDSINSIIQDTANTYWIATSSGLYHSKDIKSNWQQVEIEQPFRHISVSALAIDDNGNLWVGTYKKGLFFKSPSDSKLSSYAANLTFYKENPLDDINILSLMVDHHNRLWIGTYGDGLFLLENDQIHNFKLEKNNSNSISYNDILCLFEDANHVIWCGTDGGGVSFYDENLHKFNSFTNSDVPEEIHVDVIRSIIKDSKGVTWIGTSGYGLTKYHPDQLNKWQTISSRNSGLSGNRIMCLAEDQDNNMWIGTQGSGLDIYYQKSNTFTNFYQSNKLAYLPDHTIWTIVHDSHGRHWIGTRDQGLCLFNPKHGIIKQYIPANSDIPGQSIRVISMENEQALWIGTENNGLCRLDLNTDQFEIYQSVSDTSQTSISSNLIKSIYLDKDYIWIGTSGGGLNVMNLEDKSIKVYTSLDGLPNDVIYAILPDENNNLWLSTNRGISKFTAPKLPTHPESSPVIVNYDNYDGLQGLEFNTGAYYKDREGFLYFGGINGFNWFKPSEIALNKQSSPAIINEIEVNGTSIIADTITSRIRHLKLNHDQNALSFSFSTLNFSMPHRNTYKYKLIGFDEDWISSGFRNYVSYTNLKPGSYLFSVLGGNYDGVFHDNPASIKLLIKPPWWNTPFAYLAGIFLIGIVSFLIYRFQRNRWLLNTQLQLEFQEKERLKELDLFKSRLYTNITHEFRTPLTVILGLIEKSRQYLNTRDTSKFTDVVDIVQRNANRLLHLVNQMLDLSRLESKSIRLNMVNGDLVLFLRNLIAMYESHAANHNLSLEFECAKSELFLDFDPENIQKIISNLITNAIKFTDKGEIIVSIDELQINGKAFVGISVKDTGIGIAEEHLPRIFERFYRIDDTDKKSMEGSGVGMALVKELVEIMGGAIDIKSKLGVGTTVIFSLPVTQNAVTQDIHTQLSSSTVKETPDQPDVSVNQPKQNGDPIVLLIEDNQDVLYYLTTCLQNKYQLIQASNGTDGVNKAIEHVPDIVISDVMMPGKTGYEVCEMLKQDTRTSHIPVILLTAKAEMQDKISGITHGADAYLIKPFNVDELLAQVDNLIRSRELLRQKFQNVYTHDNALVDLPQKENEFLHSLNELIKKELNNPELNVDKVCEQLYMSRTQLHRKITALADKSITAYIRTYRLKEAISLIKNSELSIQQIAFETGFSDASYFHRSFVKEFNKKPTEFRD